MCIITSTFMPHSSSSLLQDYVPATGNFQKALKKKTNPKKSFPIKQLKTKKQNPIPPSVTISFTDETLALPMGKSYSICVPFQPENYEGNSLCLTCGLRSAGQVTE